MNVKRNNLLVDYDLVSCGEEDNSGKKKTALSNLICPHLVLLSIAALCSAVPLFIITALIYCEYEP